MFGDATDMLRVLAIFPAVMAVIAVLFLQAPKDVTDAVHLE